MKKDCTTCEYAEWELKPGGSRDLQKGTCVKSVVLPNSFVSLRGDLPYRNPVSKYTKSDCQCWEKRKEKP